MSTETVSEITISFGTEIPYLLLDDCCYKGFVAATEKLISAFSFSQVDAVISYNKLFSF